ncbi:hypothetical protein AB0I34_38880 [Kribbella sp. NPDC050281]|uniref:hypothetical protein n=1 Tax=Kribbella sp. NPDC050281 TaxID=3155515 RepID=UPI0033CAF928
MKSARELPAIIVRSGDDSNYAMTRAFYRSVGFLPLEETPAFWPGNPCLLMVKPLG